MPDPDRPERIPSSDIDPAWRAEPIGPDETLPPPTSPPRRVEPPPPPPPPEPPRAAEPPRTEPSRPVEPSEPAEAPAPVEETAPVEAGPATERLPAESSSSVTLALFVALLLGAGFVWHHAAPSRAFHKAVYLLAQARREEDPKAAAQAVEILKPYVDSTGQGYVQLFQAADLAGDDATAEAYAARLTKQTPGSADELLDWYENLLTYHSIGFKSKADAFAAAPAARALDLLDAALAHYDAAQALKPVRAKAVEGYDNGIPAAAAGHLLRIDAMHRELEAADVAALRALQDRAKNPSWRQAFESYGEGEKDDAMKDREAAYQKAVKLAPDFAEAYQGLAAVSLAQLRVDEAVDEAAKAIAILEKTGPATTRSKSELLAEAHALRGKAFFERWTALKDAKSDKAPAALESARAELDAAADQNPRCPEAIALSEALAKTQTP